MPRELKSLPAGQYIVAAYEPRVLTDEEEEGIRVGLRSIAEGRMKDAKEVFAAVDTRLRRRIRQARSRR